MMLDIIEFQRPCEATFNMICCTKKHSIRRGYLHQPSFVITQKHFYDTSIARRCALQYFSVSESLLYSYDTRSLLYSSSTLQRFVTPMNILTLHLLSHNLQFNSIRPRTGRNACLATSVWLFPLHRSGILAYHGMEWNTRRHFALHDFNPSIRSQGFYVSVWLQMYHYSTIGFWDKNRTTATGGPSSSVCSPLVSQPVLFLTSQYSTRFSLSSWRGRLSC